MGWPAQRVEYYRAIDELLQKGPSPAHYDPERAA
jgi:hypothetical protein